jgi:hypothetical protein
MNTTILFINILTYTSDEYNYHPCRLQHRPLFVPVRLAFVNLLERSICCLRPRAVVAAVRRVVAGGG